MTDVPTEDLGDQPDLTRNDPYPDDADDAAKVTQDDEAGE